MTFRSAPGARPRRFVPTLESLDQRTMPSVAVPPVVDADGILQIRGDQQANTILITDNGTTAVVVQDGETFDIADAFMGIRVVTGGGADDVDYVLTGDLSSVRTVDVFLGNNNDSFDADLQGNLLAGGSLIIVARGGNGHDHLGVDATNVDIATGASLVAVLEGGNGKDDLSIDYSGLLQGSALLSANGGNGKDSVSGKVELNSQTDETSGEVTPSDGSLTLDFRGGNGVDQMNLSVVGETTGWYFAVLDGGNGKDSFTGNITPVDPPKPK